jgi:hypothetical protein
MVRDAVAKQADCFESLIQLFATEFSVPECLVKMTLQNTSDR